MFTLRQINGEGLESNTVLGESYNVVHRDHNPGEYRRLCEHIFSRSTGLDGETTKEDEEYTKSMVKEYHKIAYCLIVYREGSQYRFLYPNQQNYIMTESGKTYSNLTFRK